MFACNIDRDRFFFYQTKSSKKFTQFSKELITVEDRRTSSIEVQRSKLPLQSWTCDQTFSARKRRLEWSERAGSQLTNTKFDSSSFLWGSCSFGWKVAMTTTTSCTCQPRTWCSPKTDHRRRIEAASSRKTKSESKLQECIECIGWCRFLLGKTDFWIEINCKNSNWVGVTNLSYLSKALKIDCVIRIAEQTKNVSTASWYALIVVMTNLAHDACGHEGWIQSLKSHQNRY